jgi:hypothetical protein
MDARLMLLERPPHRWTASQREQYEAYKRAVIKAVFNVERHDSGTWVSSREVYVAFHGHEPGGYPDPMPRFVRALKEAARGDFIDGRWSEQRRGFEWKPR